MSTHDEIKQNLGSELFELMPLDGRKVVRPLVVSLDIDSHVWPANWPDNRDGDRLAEFRAVLDAFSAGEAISVSQNPFQKDPTTILARVHPIRYGLWDIRVTHPSPGIRCLGGFTKRDSFAALVWDYRENLETAEDWSNIIEECKTKWHSLFSTAPLCGDNLDEYLSEYI